MPMGAWSRWAAAMGCCVAGLRRSPSHPTLKTRGVRWRDHEGEREDGDDEAHARFSPGTHRLHLTKT